MLTTAKVVVLMLSIIMTLLLFCVLIYPLKPLEIRIHASKTSFRRGETAYFEFYLTYGSSLFFESVTIPSLNNDVTIIGPSGAILSRREFIHRTGPVTLHRNTEMKLGELEWNLCDLSGRPVPAGLYKILISLMDWKLSSEITIEISET